MFPGALSKSPGLLPVLGLEVLLFACPAEENVFYSQVPQVPRRADIYTNHVLPFQKKKTSRLNSTQ